MRRFCIECGKEAAPEHNVCIYCGTPLPNIDMPKDEPSTGDEEISRAGKDRDVGDKVEPDIEGDKAEVDTKVEAEVEPAAPEVEAEVEPSVEQAASEAEAEAEGDVDLATRSEKSGAGPDMGKSEAGATADSSDPKSSTSEAEIAASQLEAGASSSTKGAHDTTATRKTSDKKQKAAKSKKLFLQMSAVLAILLIGFYIWMNHYTSAEAVEERFLKAIEKENVEQIQKMMVHEDHSNIESFEAEAFLKLVEKEGGSVVQSLTDTVVVGKFLYLFDAYKIEAQDQVPFSDKISELTYTFNQNEVAVFDEDEDNIAFGPLAPGIYTVGVNFSSEFGDFSVEGEVTLDDVDSDEYTYMNLDIPLADVSFYVENAREIGTEHVQLKVGKKDFSLDEYGETGIVGTLLIDGSISVEVIATMPWGEVASEPVPIEENEPWLMAEVLSEDHLKDLKKVITDFGEQFVKARAAYSTKPVKNASKAVKEIVERTFDERLVYSGKLDKVGFDEDGIYVLKEDGEVLLTVPIHFYISENYHYIEDEPELYDEFYTYDMILSYDGEDKKWKIENLEYSGWAYDATEEWKGSGDLHGPDEEAVKKASEAALSDEMEDFIIDYTKANVHAINARDFSIVSGYVTKDGPRHDEARDYIDYLDSKDIYETWIDTELETVEEVRENEWKVTVQEEFEIIRPDKTDQWRFRTVLIIKRIDGDFYVDELISTDRIDN